MCSTLRHSATYATALREDERTDRRQPLWRAARRISSVICRGCVMSDRCPESSSIVFAFMRLARKRSSSGEVVRSCLETAYQDGFERQPATVVLAANKVAETCPWTA